MPYLNADVMYMLLKYFDAQTWAKLAQVCTTWKKIAYRPSVWQALEWKPKLQYEQLFLDIHQIPCNARHIGEPTHLCFQAWARNILSQDVYNQIPRQIVREPDPSKKRSALYTFWQTQKPCIHRDHHVWTDVLRCRGYLDNLRTTDIQRLYFRIVAEPNKNPIVNSYASYLTQRMIDCDVIFLHTSGREIPIEDITEQSTDLIRNLQITIHKERYALQTFAYATRSRSYELYNESINSIISHSMTEFIDNEHQYKRRWKEMLDEIAFSS
jgi:hypothetical protein